MSSFKAAFMQNEFYSNISILQLLLFSHACSRSCLENIFECISILHHEFDAKLPIQNYFVIKVNRVSSQTI